MRTILCCLLMMTSEANKLCHVPVTNLRTNTSSAAVSAARSPSFRVPVIWWQMTDDVMK